jgi:hypothetical protein
MGNRAGSKKRFGSLKTRWKFKNAFGSLKTPFGSLKTHLEFKTRARLENAF